MDTSRYKRTAEWFRRMIFQNEPIPARTQEQLPSLLRTARSLETSMKTRWQPPEVLFIKQGKLLAQYEDDDCFDQPVVRYFPTYQALSDRELRGYFSWRTKLRRGQWVKTSASFAYLYLYELLNLIAVEDAREGFERLQEFKSNYIPLDDSLLPYLDRWMQDFVIYYDLEPAYLASSPQVVFHQKIALLQNMDQSQSEEILDAVRYLAPRWLNRSKYYAQHREDMDPVILGVLSRMHDHYKTGKRPLTEQLFGTPRFYPVRLMDAAIFVHKPIPEGREYVLHPLCIYRYQDHTWNLKQYPGTGQPCPMLENLMKAIDGQMRELSGYGHPIQWTLKFRWLEKAVREEALAQLERKKAAEAKKLRIDFSQLDAIRRNAASTREALLVEEERLEEEVFEESSPMQGEPSVDLPLSPSEYRLLQCLLCGGDLSWVRSEGLLMSVLVDGINDRLYDTFLDAVVDATEPPTLIEDYITDLKEMISP